jgi:hypothetical protein
VGGICVVHAKKRKCKRYFRFREKLIGVNWLEIS